MKKILFFILLFFTFSVHAQNAATGKLYFRTLMWVNQYGTSLDLSWLYLGSNGMIVKDPKHGVDPINYALELADNSANVGKYIIVNNKMNVTWQNGKKVAWNLETKNGDLTAIDAGLVSRPRALPAAYKLNGQFAAGAFLPNVSSVSTFVFKNNGTFTLNKSGAVSTADDSSLSKSDSNGTYTIKGNTLTLNFENGKKEVAVIWVWDQGNGKRNLVINKRSFPQER